MSLATDLLHGYDGSLDELAMTTDGKMPGSDAHQVVEGEFQDKTTVRANLDKIHAKHSYVGDIQNEINKNF